MSFDSVYIRQFSDYVYLQVEQSESHLKGMFRTEVVNGKSDVIPRIGILNTALVTENQYSPVTFSSLDTSYRYLDMSKYEVVVPISRHDVDRMKFDPTNYVGQRVASAIGRRYDDIMLAALLGAAKTGETGSSTTSLPSGNLVAVNDTTYGGSGSRGLDVPKLLHARKIILTNRKKLGLPTDNLVAIMTANQHTHLMTDDKMVNSFYNKDRPIAGEPALSLLGMDIVISEELDSFKDSNGDDQVIICDKNSLVFGSRAQGDLLRIDQRPDLSGEVWQVKGMVDVGAVRMEEELVSVISCSA